jgi:3-hydroxyacyl-[acyl-carrier-protein] dehydratase
MPGVLILGTMGKLAKHLLEHDGGGVWRLGSAGAVAFRHWVGPGDTMEVTVTLKSRDESEAILSAEVKVDGKVVTRARKLRMVPE